MLFPDSFKGYVRYDTTTQSLRSIASSATAFVRSTVKRTEFICLRIGSKGASRSTFNLISYRSYKCLNRWIHIQYCQNFCQLTLLDTLIENGQPMIRDSQGRVTINTHNLLMEFTTALVNGEALSVVYVLIFAAFIKVLRNMNHTSVKSEREKISSLWN